MDEKIAADDGLPGSEVGEWTRFKHALLAHYVKITRAVRGYWPTTGFIDLHCGYGRSRVRETGEWIDGSAMIAARAARDSRNPFTHVHVNDVDPERSSACVARLRRSGFAPTTSACDCLTAARRLASSPPLQGAYVLVFADPYNVSQLPFEALETLARLRHVDLLIYFAVSDIARNLEQELVRPTGRFDAFAPGWREHVDRLAPRDEQRRQFFAHWCGLLDRLGMRVARGYEGVQDFRNSRNSTLYWIVFASRHPRGHDLWTKVLRFARRKAPAKGDLFGG